MSKQKTPNEISVNISSKAPANAMSKALAKATSSGTLFQNEWSQTNMMPKTEPINRKEPVISPENRFQKTKKPRAQESKSMASLKEEERIHRETLVVDHKFFNRPHRLKGDGLTDEEKAKLETISDPEVRAEQEYRLRVNKTAFALRQFIICHDTCNMLPESTTLDKFHPQKGSPFFTTFQYPEKFLSTLSAILNESLGDGLYSRSSLNGIYTTNARLLDAADLDPIYTARTKLADALEQGAIPDKPFLRLAIFGMRDEVLALGNNAHALTLAQELDVSLAAAILMFCFKNTQEQEKDLAKLLYNTSANGDDAVLWEASVKYLNALKAGERPYL